MPNPIPPNSFRELLPSTQGSMCDKFVKVLTQFPLKFYQWYSYVYREDGEFTDDFKDDLCAAGCAGGGSVIPPVISASDDLTDKIVINWGAVSTAVGGYKVYRSTDNNPDNSAEIGTTDEGVTMFEDTTPTTGQIRWYWVTAVGANSIESDYSNADSGVRPAALAVGAVPAFRASRGTYANKVRLDWGVASGAVSYNLFKATVNSFGSAVQEGGDITALFYEDADADEPGVTYFYWIKAKNGSDFGPLSGAVSGFIQQVGQANQMPEPGVSVSNGFLRWNLPASVNAASFVVYYGTSADPATATRVQSVNGSTLALNVSGFCSIAGNQGRFLYFFVQAFSPDSTVLPSNLAGPAILNCPSA